MQGGVYLPGKPATLYVKTLKLPLVVALVWRTGEERAGVRKRARLTQRNKDCMTRDERRKTYLEQDVMQVFEEVVVHHVGDFFWEGCVAQLYHVEIHAERSDSRTVRHVKDVAYV